MTFYLSDYNFKDKEIDSWIKIIKDKSKEVYLSKGISLHFIEGGENNISYTVFGTAKEDKSTFKWSQQDNYVTVESEESEFAKTWIVIKNERNFQRWQSTDGNNQVQVLELKK